MPGSLLACRYHLLWPISFSDDFHMGTLARSYGMQELLSVQPLDLNTE